MEIKENTKLIPAVAGGMTDPGIPTIRRVTPTLMADGGGSSGGGTTYSRACSPCTPCYPDSDGPCSPCSPCCTKHFLCIDFATVRYVLG